MGPLHSLRIQRGTSGFHWVFTLRTPVWSWQVQGPLDVLKKACTNSTAETEERSSVKFILERRERLETYREQVRENLREA